MPSFRFPRGIVRARPPASSIDVVRARPPVRPVLPPRGPAKPAEFYRDLELNPIFNMKGGQSAPTELRSDAGVFYQYELAELLSRHHQLLISRTASINLSGTASVQRSARLTLLTGILPTPPVSDGYMLSAQLTIVSSTANFGGAVLIVRRPNLPAAPIVDELVMAWSTPAISAFAGATDQAGWVIPDIKPDFPLFLGQDDRLTLEALFTPGTGSISFRYSGVLAPKGVKIPH